jgi:hypothetical protein
MRRSGRLRPVKVWVGCSVFVGVYATGCTVFDVSRLTGGAELPSLQVDAGSVPKRDAGTIRTSDPDGTGKSEPRAQDAGIAQDSASPIATSDPQDSGPPTDVREQAFCRGWSYCDDFEGAGNMKWSRVGARANARVSVSRSRARDGAQSLAILRPAGSVDFAFLEAEGKLKECEFDVLVSNVFSGKSPALEFAYIQTSHSTYGVEKINRANVGGGGFYRQYRGDQNSITETAPTGSGSHLERWVHVGMSVGFADNATASATGFFSFTDLPPEISPGVFWVPPLPVAVMKFGIGVYETKAQTAVEMYVDNVRCR